MGGVFVVVYLQHSFLVQILVVVTSFFTISTVHLE